MNTQIDKCGSERRGSVSRRKTVDVKCHDFARNWLAGEGRPYSTYSGDVDRLAEEIQDLMDTYTGELSERIDRAMDERRDILDASR